MKSFVSLTLILLFLACQNGEQHNTNTDASAPKETSRNIDYQKVAIEICACAQPSIELHQELLDFQRKKNKKAITELIPKAERTALKTIECSQNNRTVKQNPVLRGASLDKALQNNCDNLPVMLREELVLKLGSNEQ